MIGPTSQAVLDANILRCGCPPSLTGVPIMWLGEDNVTEYYGVAISRRWQTDASGTIEYLQVMPSGTTGSVRVYRDRYHAFLDADLKRYRSPVYH